MKNKILIIIISFLLPIAVISFFKKETNFNLEKETRTIRVKINNEIITIPLEEYVIGVVSAEMPALFHEEALKAQALASRTYAVNKIDGNKEYDVDSTKADQVYITIEEMKDKWQDDYELYYNKIKKAVNDTESEIITYNNEPIEAFYFSTSNGKTENAELVFKEAKPYLQSVDSTWDSANTNYEVSQSYSKEEFCEKLSLNNCETITINNIERSNSNRVNVITINNIAFSGTTIRSKLNLRSTDFNIEIKETIEITTKGYGHGVGMSQYGANGMAKEGKTYEEIIKHYYQGVQISKI